MLGSEVYIGPYMATNQIAIILLIIPRSLVLLNQLFFEKFSFAKVDIFCLQHVNHCYQHSGRVASMQ